MKIGCFCHVLILFIPNVTLKTVHRQPSTDHPRTVSKYPIPAYDKKPAGSASPNKKPSELALIAKNLPSPLRRSIILALEKADIPHFFLACLKKGICTKDQVIHGISGKPWRYRTKHRRPIMHFWQIYECYAHHRPLACPVDGEWSAWSSWAPCTVPCGRGLKTRRRTCTNPAPVNYGKPCSGRALEREPCHQQCPKNFTDLAGKNPLRLQALRSMRRIEQNFESVAGVCSKEHCTFHQVHELIPDTDAADQYWLSMHCVERYVGCPIDGGWSDWQPWSNCTTPCGIGDRFRIRGCHDPPPSNGGKPCVGDPFEREDCLGTNCSRAEQSVWTDWSDWSTCSAKDCITYGTQTSRRICISVIKPAICDVGDGTTKSTLERRRPCVKKGCFHKQRKLPYSRNGSPEHPRNSRKRRLKIMKRDTEKTEL